MRRVSAGLIVVVALLSLANAGPASAAPGDKATGRVTFGVRPAELKPGEVRPTFAYAATPGGVLSDRVEVSNAGTRPLVLKVYAHDAFNPRLGGFDLLAAGHKPT